jgi:OmpA-OmpF porin, OOP family
MSHRIFFIALVVGMFSPAVGFAQTQGIAVNSFDVAERGSDWFVGDSLDLRGSARPAIGFVLDYAHKPLVLYDEQGKERAVVISDQLFAHLGASLVLADRLRLAFNMPVALVSKGSSTPYQDTTLTAASGPAPGDLRFGVDLRLFGRYGGPITMALGGQLYLPTGDPEAFTGDGKVRVLGHLTAAGRVAIFEYSARASLMYRPQDASMEVTTGTTVQFAAAAGLSLVDHKLLLGPEIWGSTVVVDGHAFDKETTPFELTFGAHYRPRNFRFGAAFGPGLTRGVGAPVYRVLGMFEWAPSFDEDRDHDGIIDDNDACPDVPGVPDPDPKKNGCPRPPDRDGDGIIDPEDACPDVPGVRSDDPTKNGCPLPSDRDHDNIIDREDDCPDLAGPPSEVPGRNGCPDTDGDGIIDPQDACPKIPGPPDPDPTKNGCPIARIEKDQIVITQRVEFETGSDKLLPSSTGILIAVLNILQEHNELTKVLVEGHTDNVGGAVYNKGLSERRARSVVKWLVAHGVPQVRLLDAGFGLERPLDTNGTAEGRQRNRRVEFHIVDGNSKQAEEP